MATRAALTALADALSLPRRQLRLVRGATSRLKLVEFDVDATMSAEITARLERLAGPPNRR